MLEWTHVEHGAVSGLPLLRGGVLSECAEEHSSRRERVGGSDEEGSLMSASDSVSMCDELQGCSDESGNMNSASGRDMGSDEDGSEDERQMGMESPYDLEQEYGHPGFEGATQLNDESHTPFFLWIHAVQTRGNTTVYECISNT
jgi:hypothetical protein